MQKEAGRNDIFSKKETNTQSVGNIFRTMAYNENQVENFSTILSWVSSKKGDTLSSVINGESLDGPCGEKSKFVIGQKSVNVASLDAKSLESILPSIKSPKLENEGSGNEKKATERLGKFEGLMKTLIADLCTTESIAVGVPRWQIVEFNQPTWNLKKIIAQDETESDLRKTVDYLSKKNRVIHVLMRLRKEDYCLRDVLSILILAVQSEGKFTLTISLDQDASCVLPVAYLIDALNKSTILKFPIDLLIIRPSKDVLTILLNNPILGDMFWCGDIEDYCSISARILTGEFRQMTRSVHFILDSTADVPSAVESIAADAWTSGSKVRTRARSLLFVHQPVYQTVIKALTQKINSLRISADVTEKSSDFISRTVPESIDLQKVLAQGVKIYPQPVDFSRPTLISEIGTSTDLISNAVHGFGHLLCVIPYRSIGELLSLTSNFGTNACTRIHASNSDIVKKLGLNIRGGEIWVNSSGKYNGEERLTNITNWALLQSSNTSPSEGKQDIGGGKDEFSNGLLGAEKGLKAWASIGAIQRYNIGEHVLLSTLKNEPSIGESDKVRYLIDLMRIIAQPFNNGQSDNDSESFTIWRTKPIGIVGIVLVNPEQMSLTSLISPILSVTLKGNAAIVVSVSSSIPNSVVESCNFNFPIGLVNFINSSSVKDSFTKLSQHGKVSVVWVVNGTGQGSQLNEIPFKPFITLIIQHQDFIRPSSSFVPSAQFVEISKVIHW